MSNFYKGLMDELDAEQNRTIQEIKERHWEEEREAYQKFGDRKRAVQAACPHDNKRRESDFDYHKREDWTNIFCADCGKLLDRI